GATARFQRSPSGVSGRASALRAKSVQWARRVAHVSARSSVSGGTRDGTRGSIAFDRCFKQTGALPPRPGRLPFLAPLPPRPLRLPAGVKVPVHSAMEIDVGGLAVADRYKLLIGCITPRPIALVSTMAPAPDERLNLAPFSFFNGIGSDP